MRKRFTNPFIMSMSLDSEGGGSGAPNPKPDEDAGKQKGPDFPADTAVKDMTPEQQAAYWKHHAQKHENRVKAYGGVTPEQALKAAEDQEEARKKALSETDRAVEDARTAARNEVLTEAAKREADTALKLALRGRVIDGEKAFDRPEFVKDGAADVEAIVEWVDANSQPAAKSGNGNNALRNAAGNREALRTSGRESGRAEAEKRFGKKS